MSLEESFNENLENLDQFIIRPVSRTEEKELYAGFYERIYPAVQSILVDYAELAHRSGLKERRIREVLLYRLSGEVPQLFGCEKGICYVCREGLYRRETTEPICLACLQKIDRAMEDSGLYQAILAGKKPTDEEKHFPETRQPDLPDEFTEDGTMEMIPRAEYDRLVRELDLCKQTIVELGGTLPTGMAHEITWIETSTPEESNLRQTSEPVIPLEAEFLSILDLPDNEIPTEWMDGVTPPEVRSIEGLRHYGFKRLKGR